MGLALVLEVLLHGHARRGQLLLDALAAGVELVGDQRLGQRHVDPLEQHLEDGVAGGGGLLEALAAAQALAHVGVSSSAVSNSEAIWANSSSTSGSSCSCTWSR